MRITHPLAVFYKFMCQFHIIQEAVFIFTVAFFPGSEMNFINRHRLRKRILFRALLHPRTVFPVISVDHSRAARIRRTKFRMECIRIRFVKHITLLCCNGIFICFTFLHIFDESFENTALFKRDHVVGSRIPCISVTNDGNCFGMRRPYCEMPSLLAIMNRRMRTHLLVDLIISSLSEQITVIFRQEYRVQRGIRFLLRDLLRSILF